VKIASTDPFLRNDCRALEIALELLICICMVESCSLRVKLGFFAESWQKGGQRLMD
jgi:hypothetical protein